MTEAAGTRTPGGHLEVARTEQAVLMRVVDIGNMNIALTLHDFVHLSLKDGYRYFALDLAACSGMDSTFMGTMVGLAKSIRENDGWLCMCNVGEDNRQRLAQLGVSKFVPVKEKMPLEEVEMTRLAPENDPERRLTLIKQAHEDLVTIDERNRQRFGMFLAALASEMGEGKDMDDMSKEAEKGSDIIIIGAADGPSPAAPPCPLPADEDTADPAAEKLEE